jgi:plastocyanin
MAVALGVAIIGTADMACAGPAPEHTMALKVFAFAPSSITVQSGTTVTWKNFDEEPHTVVSTTGLFRSDALDQNDSFSFKFEEPGEYRFICSIHPQMRGTVIVTK